MPTDERETIRKAFEAINCEPFDHGQRSVQFREGWLAAESRESALRAALRLVVDTATNHPFNGPDVLDAIQVARSALSASGDDPDPETP